MQQVNCYCCAKTIWLFQAKVENHTHHGIDGSKVEMEEHLCYWCAGVEEEKNEAKRG